ncbi:hypothetical protein B4U45_10095 [Mycobacterium persicum]|uniref:DUF732 domain-containing protein n=2 Tax=Mycobacterium persicum TaxID=1487726 RepID=A0A8E2IRX2_9MYCO|nr:DUF732 domain-containing protein [Mycobacterium persicum]KZS84721.1 hypothetical protein A4G31_09305 [Mycobacterium persicum]ORB52493.1 hypothetical protein BST40_09270 [Mycobacterium persicum]ORB94915.1 hypothetical protein B1T44_10775 [Mycobacterium persicum]ORC06914.1 hypothetical protein B4U45_10095 [Mycobacterium persicum]
MKTFTMIPRAVFVVLASFLSVSSMTPPLARAEGTACESRGFDLATCDQYFLDDLRKRGVPFTDPGAAIRIGHGTADYLTQHPTMKGITAIANRLIKDNSNVNFTVQNAVNFIKVSAHYYGPPGLEEQLEAAAS